jgi:sugar (pentulose or hexulose) kinase
VEHPLEVVGVEEPGCLGSVVLAGVGVGEFRDIQAATVRTLRIALRTSPDPKTAAIYRRRREVFNETYRLLEPILYTKHM